MLREQPRGIIKFVSPFEMPSFSSAVCIVTGSDAELEQVDAVVAKTEPMLRKKGQGETLAINRSIGQKMMMAKITHASQ